jgi:ABC-2 type transport system ATP-binding protein
MSEAIVVRNVTKNFSNQYRSTRRWSPATGLPVHSPSFGAKSVLSALDDVAFRVQAGEIFGVVGPHGAGKTTLVHLLGGLLPPDNGTIQLFGYDVVRQAAQARALTNPISGQASFFQRLSALENLAYGTNLAGMSGQEARQHAAELLSQLGAQPHEMNLPLVAVSRSMYQKVALVKALLFNPRLLLLDEPLHGMEPYDRQRALKLLKALSEREGITILYATRDYVEAHQFCSRLIQLENGRIVGEEKLQIQAAVHNIGGIRHNWTSKIQDSIPHSKVQQEELV